MLNNKNKILFLFTFLIIISSLGCNPAVYQSNINNQIYNKNSYDSAFPFRESSKQLENIGNTIHRINSIAYYEAYIIPFDKQVEKLDISDSIITKVAIEKIFYTKTSSGTSTIIYSQRKKIVLLTGAHIIDFPDTIITYYSNSKGITTNYVKSISVKKKEVIYAVGFPEKGDLQVLSMDREKDLALLTKEFEFTYPGKFPKFSYPLGKTNQLNWGSFVYLFGYPLNFKMISRAIVSKTSSNKDKSFILDAVVNRGYSGGIVLAVRNGVPNFELIGIIKSVPKEIFYSLKPEQLKDNDNYDPLAPYEGKTYVQSNEKIEYGIAKVIPIEVILDFLKDNKFKIYTDNTGVSYF